MKQIILILMAFGLLSRHIQAADGDTFTINTTEGIAMTCRVISEKEKTAKVGIGNGAPAISQSTSGTVTIPSEVTYNNETYTVTLIELSAFYRCFDVTAVHIPNSITKIGRGAFESCTRLESIDIPSNVITIEQAAFYGCTSLTSIKVPETVTEWGYNVFGNCSGLKSIHISNDAIMNASDPFNGCTGLKSITFSNEVTKIGKGVFKGCTGLESIDIPSNIKMIRQEAFKDCKNLTSVTLHEGLETIEDAAFNACISLESINIPNSVTNIGSKIVYSNASGTFAGCKALKTITWGNGITLIPSHGFYGCTSLESINLPNNLQEIGTDAFTNCTNLTGDIVLPYGTTYIGSGAFANTKITSIKIPQTVTSFAANALSYSTSIKKVIVPSLEHWCSVIDFSQTFSITGFAGDPTGNLHYADLYIKEDEDNPIRDVIIPEGVKRVNKNAFYDASITSADIPSSVDSVFYEAFYKCRKMKTIKFHEGLKYIGVDAFAFCNNLSSINLPNGLLEIQTGAFANDNKLKSITIPNSVTTIGDAGSGYPGVFAGCESLESVKIGNGLTKIPMAMFASCTNLQFVEIPNSVTTIGMNAFGGCKRLKKIIFPNSITNVPYTWGTGAFDGCDSLIQVIVPDFNIADWCWKYLPGGPLCYTHHIYDYEGNDLIVDAVIPEGVTQVIGSAFQGCESLISLTLPSTLTSIYSKAFYNCCNLKSVTCKMQEPDININSFQYFAGISPECILYVPIGTKEAYTAKGWNENIFKGGIVEYNTIVSGDANGDGSVNVFDVTAMVNYILGSPNDSFDFGAADVNGDGTVNVFDVTKVVNIILGVDAGAKRRTIKN